MWMSAVLLAHEKQHAEAAQYDAMADLLVDYIGDMPGNDVNPPAILESRERLKATVPFN